MNKFNILGFPRSGNHWISYILNFFYDKHITDQSIFKNHHIFPSDNKPLIFIVRNPMECMIRHYGIGKVLSKDNMALFLSSSINTAGYTPSLFWNNVTAFDKFTGNKILIYYEDLITSPHNQIKKLANFVNIDDTKAQHFLENIDEYKQDSINWYTSKERSKAGDKSMSKGNDVLFHSKQLSDIQIKDFRDYFKLQNIDLYNKYLKKYEK